MPGMSGLEVLRAIGEERMPPTIFTTPYAEYALDAFGAAAVGRSTPSASSARWAGRAGRSRPGAGRERGAARAATQGRSSASG